MKGLKLMAEYGGTVLWKADPGEVGPIGVEDVPIPEPLRSSLRAWAAWYDTILDPVDPSASGFKTDELDAFDSQGREIWKQLQQALGPDCEVTYFSEKERRLLTPTSINTE